MLSSDAAGRSVSSVLGCREPGGPYARFEYIASDLPEGLFWTASGKVEHASGNDPQKLIQSDALHLAFLGSRFIVKKTSLPRSSIVLDTGVRHRRGRNYRGNLKDWYLAKVGLLQKMCCYVIWASRFLIPHNKRIDSGVVLLGEILCPI